MPGLLSFTKALAEDCAKDNVLVTGVNPGPIDTPRWQSLREAAVRTRGMTAEQYDGRAIAGGAARPLGTSEECAAVVLFLCSARASYRDRRDHQHRRRRHALHITGRVAELGAAFFSAELALTPELRSDHASDLDHWPPQSTFM